MSEPAGSWAEHPRRRGIGFLGVGLESVLLEYLDGVTAEPRAPDDHHDRPMNPPASLCLIEHYVRFARWFA
jgi:hypothetical protein